MILNPLDVIWIFDDLITPPHPKMVVCVQPEDGLFFRINSRPFLKPVIPLIKDPLHPWLDHDSYLHVDILLLDDYIVEKAVRRGGVIGTVSPLLSTDIKKTVLNLRDATLHDKQRICWCLP